MSSWKVTYRDRTGAETTREVTADEMRRTAEWIDFVDRADERKRSNQWCSGPSTPQLWSRWLN